MGLAYLLLYQTVNALLRVSKYLMESPGFQTRYRSTHYNSPFTVHALFRVSLIV